jgi:glutathione reductase (NADPH)
MSFDYDLFVIGGGSGGVRAARVAAAEGAKVALAESSRMGGTCVIRGCVPKKLMVFASGYRESLAEASDYGWDVTAGEFSWPPFKERLNKELDRLEEVYRSLLNNSDVEIFDARARLKDPHTVEVDGKTVTAKHILIATGGRPVKPDMPNAALGMVSDDLFQMERLPKSILIVGAGYIACEFACVLNNMGVEVEMFIRKSGILRGFDEEAAGLVSEMMQKKGIKIHFGTTIVEMQRAGDVSSEGRGDAAMGAPASEQPDVAANSEGGTDGPIWVKASNGQEREFDQVLFATGRRPNTDDLGLDTTAVKMGRKGEIEVDEFSQTAQPSIYAIGDVTERVTLTPVAIREGMAFVETVFKGNPTPVDHALIPSAVFTQPEMGTVGLSEEDASSQEPVDVYSTSFRPMQQAFLDRPDRVLMKLIVSKETDVVLGCHIVAPGAGEMIQMAGIAIKMGATKAQFDQVCAVHPTMSEELVTMKTPTRSA